MSAEHGFKRLDKNRPSSTAPQAGTLPAAGHARTEELKRRTDQLEAQAEVTHANVEAIDPDSMDVERELANQFNFLDVSKADHTKFVYKWVNFVNNGGIMMRQSIAPPERWQIVNGDMPEAKELASVDGTRKLGDVMLVRMPIARYRMLEKVRSDASARQQQAAANNMREIAGKSGIKVHTIEDAPPNIAKAMTHPSPAAVAEMRGRLAAEQQFESALRSGAIAV